MALSGKIGFILKMFFSGKLLLSEEVRKKNFRHRNKADDIIRLCLHSSDFFQVSIINQLFFLLIPSGAQKMEER